MRIIKVYGSLAKFLGQRSFKAAVNTPAEAVRFLLANFPQLQAHMAEQHYKVSVGRVELEAADAPEQLHYPVSKREAIRIVPVMAGAGAAGRIIAGVALLVAAFAIPGFQAWAGPLAFNLITGVGVALTLGGVSQLLSPAPKLNTGTDSNADPKKSYSFSGIQNVSRSGVPVPVVYGEMLVGSVVISAGLTSNEVVVVD